MLNKRHKILVVDDEHAIASALASILERQGYVTATAYSGEEAIQAACSFQPDFILCDVMMGTMNGVDAAMEILRAQPKCKVLFISGNARYRDLLGKARAEGFNFVVGSRCCASWLTSRSALPFWAAAFFAMRVV